VSDIPPLLPLSLFRSRAFSTATAIGLLLNLGFYGMLYLIPVYFQQARGYDALASGPILLPAVGLAMFPAPIGGRITARYGAFGPTVLYLLAGAAGLACLLFTGHSTAYWVFLVPLVLAGLAAPLTVTAVTSAIMEAAPAQKAGVASAVLTASRQTRNTVGVALFGTLAATAPTLVDGLRISAAIAPVVFVLGSGLAFLGSRRSGPSCKYRATASSLKLMPTCDATGIRTSGADSPGEPCMGPAARPSPTRQRLTRISYWRLLASGEGSMPSSSSSVRHSSR